ncbi:magnesium-translocating P-type ATPase [Candidatus Profftia lariciata]|uniref:magnesium-translocating P-type ATPase n=1 Tax=Candidatus Profftia lariciata TaxID=1987921 RepID=UPI001D00CF02|nr:magnesium-translocating P-type ATPase [Candidatus Profftia lariciata]
MIQIIKNIITKIYGDKTSQQDTYLIEDESIVSIDTTISKFTSNINGLTEDDAYKRLLAIGPNYITHAQQSFIVSQLINIFKNPFIFILLFIAIIIFLTDYVLPLYRSEEPNTINIIIILIMISLSGLLCFYQEFRTNKIINNLKYLVHNNVTVLRRSDLTEKTQYKSIPFQELVPGDIILLSDGDLIPADIKLIESHNLFVNQSAFTGEAISIAKYVTTADIKQKICNNTVNKIFDLSNICMMGTNVSSGTAKAIVVATGVKTYFGSLAQSVINTRSQTAFDHGLNKISKMLIRFMLIIVPIVFFINGLTKGCWTDAALFALAVSVGLTPEMFPVIISSNLTRGAIKLSKNKVIVKRLNAIQNLGAMDVLCTDKTGTLTKDCIILNNYIDINGYKNQKILQLAWLNSYYQSEASNLMDKAIIKYTQKYPEIQEIAQFSKIGELPFDFIRRLLSVVVSDKQHQHTLICKGAVEEMLSIATHTIDNENILPLNDKMRTKLLQLANHYNQKGFRVLMIGTRNFGVKGCILPINNNHEQNLVIHGLLTFLDPPKSSAAEAILALHKQGIIIKVLTGDAPIITNKICQDLGLETSKMLLGDQIENMNDQQLAELVEQHTVFTKLAPLQKSRILKILMSNGHTVGFLGDAINDAPALRDADVGISVDTGTNIAKESADIVLLEKNLQVLEKAIIIGRETFGNIIKYLHMTASANFGNVLSVVVASFFIPFLPMLAIQLLLQNLIYDISQFILSWDVMDKEFLQKPRQWDVNNINRFILWFGPTSSIFDIITYAIMWFVFTANSIEYQGIFQSGWFIESLLSQMLVVHMLRTQKIPFIQSTAALPVSLITIIIIILSIYIPFSSFGHLFGLQPLPWQYFPWLVSILFSYCVITQVMKSIYINCFRQWF